MPYIEFAEVQVAYGKYVTALRDLNLQIERGEMVFLLGHSGSGKSTMLKLLYREVVATGGNVSFDGTNLGELREKEVPYLRRRMGIVPQDFGLLPRKRAWENIGYAMRAVGKSKSEVRKNIGRIVESVNMAHRADAFPHELSGGEQQRLAIARSLINDPELILADEPTGNLDPVNSEEVMSVLKGLHQAGATVIVATHDMEVLKKFAGRVVQLEYGRLVSDEVQNV